MFTNKNIKISIAVLIGINLFVFAYFAFSTKETNQAESKIIPNIVQLVLLSERNTLVKEKITPVIIDEPITEAIPSSQSTTEKAIDETFIDEDEEVTESDTILDEIAYDDFGVEEEEEQEELEVAIQEPEIKIDNTLCYTIGPFEKNADKIHSQNQLSNLAIETQVRIILEKEISSYYLYIPSHKTLKAAQNTIAKLKKKRVRDFYLLRKGDRTNAIALGLFSQEKHALRKFDLLKKLYFKVKMEVRYIDKEVYWLDYQGKESVLNAIDLQDISPLPLQLYLRQCA